MIIGFHQSKDIEDIRIRYEEINGSRDINTDNGIQEMEGD
jgi:hypothetical protein